MSRRRPRSNFKRRTQYARVSSIRFLTTSWNAILVVRFRTYEG